MQSMYFIINIIKNRYSKSGYQSAYTYIVVKEKNILLTNSDENYIKIMLAPIDWE